MENALWRAEPDPLMQAQALRAEGRAPEAVQLLKALVGSARAGLLARLEYARALVESGKVADALEAARETILLYPEAAVAALALGEIMLAMDRVAIAIAEFQRALRIDPELDRAREMLGRAWLEAGEPEKALQALEAISEHGEGIIALVEEAQATRKLPRSNARYVRHLFDQFSADYDARMLGELGYAAPCILRDLATLVLPRAKGLAVLDLGCGTGLAGEAFRDLAARLDGIDLSPAMIERARLRGIYNALTVGDLETGIPKDAAYDLAIAADTLVYIGDLRAVLASVVAALNSGGAFLFTVERTDVAGYALGPKRRWLHSESYVRAEAERAGFAVAGAMDCSPRTEAGVPVRGLAVALIEP